MLSLDAVVNTTSFPQNQDHRPYSSLLCIHPITCYPSTSFFPRRATAIPEERRSDPERALTMNSKLDLVATSNPLLSRLPSFLLFLFHLLSHLPLPVSSIVPPTKNKIMCFGAQLKSSVSATFDSSEPSIKPVTEKERNRKMSREEKDKIKMAKGFEQMARGNSTVVARRCC